jgi:hypothetical protein
MENCCIPWSCKPTGISQCRLTHNTHFRDLKCMCTHNKISHIKLLQRTTPSWLGALASKKYMRTLCYPPTTFLFLQLKSKLDFSVRGRHTNNHIFEQNLPRNLLFKIVSEENFLLVGCSSLQILYENIVLPSYPFFVPAVEEKT